jgi:hypothetical protein
MWGVLRTAVVATLILFLLHQIYNHLQSTLTVPRVADLVNRPEKKYADIEAILKPDEMKNELGAFLNGLKN